MVRYKLQFKQKGTKRFYDFSTRKLVSLADAKRMKRRAVRYTPKTWMFKIKRK